jgi:holo-[acyl-carrier protein] synthase
MNQERIIGLGTDLVEIPRIEESITKFGDRFLEKIFLPGEITYAQSQSRPAAHLAARFAAKEAAAKAFGTGIGESLSWLGLEVGRQASGEPFLRFHSAAVDLARTRGVTRTLLSLSHTQTLASATVTLIGS